MAAWRPGRSTIDYLLDRGRLERLTGGDATVSAEGIVGRAELRLKTARAGLDGGDVDGAFVAAYDAFRMAAESLLVRQALRATIGDGSHVAVEDAVSAQFAAEIAAFAKSTFEHFRRTRHAAQYFDPEAAEITIGDARWAIDTARAAVEGVRRLSETGPPPVFDP